MDVDGDGILDTGTGFVVKSGELDAVPQAELEQKGHFFSLKVATGEFALSGEDSGGWMPLTCQSGLSLFGFEAPLHNGIQLTQGLRTLPVFFKASLATAALPPTARTPASGSPAPANAPGSVCCIRKRLSRAKPRGAKPPASWPAMPAACFPANPRTSRMRFAVPAVPISRRSAASCTAPPMPCPMPARTCGPRAAAGPACAARRTISTSGCRTTRPRAGADGCLPARCPASRRPASMRPRRRLTRLRWSIMDGSKGGCG